MQNYSENTKKMHWLLVASLTEVYVSLCEVHYYKLGKFFIFLQGYSCWYALFRVKEFGSQVKKLLWTKKTVLNICKYDRVKKTFHGCFHLTKWYSLFSVNFKWQIKQHLPESFLISGTWLQGMFLYMKMEQQKYVMYCNYVEEPTIGYFGILFYHIECFIFVAGVRFWTCKRG